MNNNNPRDWDHEELTPELRQIARAILRDEAGSDDLIQDVWVISLTVSRDNFDSHQAWLKAVTRSKAFNTRRSKRRRLFHEQQAAPVDRTDSTPFSELSRAELLQALLGKIQDLGEPYASTMLSHYMDGESVAQIAHRLDRPEGTIKSHLRRGRSKLRQGLAGEEDSLHVLAFALIGALRWELDDLPEQPTSLVSSSLGLFSVVAVLGLVGTTFLWGKEPIRMGAGLDGRTGDLMAATGNVADKDPGAFLEIPKAPALSRESVGQARKSQTRSPQVQSTTEAAPPTYSVAVQAVDLHGAPVPFAQLWSGWGGSFAQRLEMDAQGKAVLTIEASDLVGARKPGEEGIHLMMRSPRHVDSWRHFFDPRLEKIESLKLTLRGTGCTVIGSVIDEQGNPVQGAVVSAPRRQGSLGKNLAGVRTLRGAPEVITGLSGHFEMAGLPAQSHLLVVTHPSFVHGLESYEGSGALLERSCTVVLEKGSDLHGIVVNGSGEPVEGASVEYKPRFGDWVPSRSVISDSTGAFLIPHVSAVEGKLWGKWQGESGRLVFSLAEHSGHPLRLELNSGERMEFLVADSDGNPVHGAQVRLHDRIGGWYRDAYSDQEGTIVVQADFPSPLLASLYPPKPRSAFPIGTYPVTPSKNEVASLTCDPELVARGKLVGSVLDSEGNPIEGAKVWVTQQKSRQSGRYGVIQSTGELVLANLPHGHYDLALVVEGQGALPLGSVEIAVERVVMKPFMIEPKGELAVEWGWHPSDESVRHSLLALLGRFEGEPLLYPVALGAGKPPTNWDLYPGEYLLVKEGGADGRREARPVVVRSRQTTPVRMGQSSTVR